MRPVVALILCWLGYFGALGLFFPFLSIYLTNELGLSPHAATSWFALMPAMTLVVPPVIGLVADAERARAWLLRGCALASAIGFAAFLSWRGRLDSTAWLIVGAGFLLFAACRAPMTSLLDAIAFEIADKLGTHYGRLRLWGSIGFALAVWGGARLVDHTGLPPLFVTGAALLFVVAGASWLLPAPHLQRRQGTLRLFRLLLAERRTRLLVATIFVSHIAGSSYDSTFSMHVVSLGYPRSTAALLWAIGVGAEIGVLLASDRIIRRVGTERLLALALVVAAGRWALTAAATSLPWLYVAQPLHGISFGLYYVVCARAMRGLGPELPTATQGLLASSFGLGGVVGMVMSGRLFELGGGRLVFSVAAGLALVAAALAGWFVVEDRAAHADGPEGQDAIDPAARSQGT